MLLPKEKKLLIKYSFIPKSWKEPRRNMCLRDICGVRINIETDKRGNVIYPEYFDGSKWHKFYFNTFFATLDRKFITDRTRGNRLKQDWSEWLDEWIKLNHLRIKKQEKSEERTEKVNVKKREIKIENVEEKKNQIRPSQKLVGSDQNFKSISLSN